MPAARGHQGRGPGRDHGGQAAGAPAPPAKISEGEGRAAATRALLVGHRAPAATLPLLDGGSVALAELAGRKPVYLKFWATWCKPCRKQMPHLEGDLARGLARLRPQR